MMVSNKTNKPTSKHRRNKRLAGFIQMLATPQKVITELWLKRLRGFSNAGLSDRSFPCTRQNHFRNPSNFGGRHYSSRNYIRRYGQFPGTARTAQITLATVYSPGQRSTPGPLPFALDGISHVSVARFVTEGLPPSLTCRR
ncbi:hypothetical protein J6590_029833 [Homalodisca vitripennis]|nr:hypothetical protein J6590_029833 [Homalodisca vitripennis]